MTERTEPCFYNNLKQHEKTNLNNIDGTDGSYYDGKWHRTKYSS